MRGDFDEDEIDDEQWECFEDTCVCADGMCGDSEAEAEVCADCGRIIHGEDVCGVCCGEAMCFACFGMGAGVCKGPHRDRRRRKQR